MMLLQALAPPTCPCSSECVSCAGDEGVSKWPTGRGLVMVYSREGLVLCCLLSRKVRLLCICFILLQCAHRYMDNYKIEGEFMDLDLLDHLGDAMLLNERLMFLGICVWVCGYVMWSFCHSLQPSIVSITSCTRVASLCQLVNCWSLYYCQIQSPPGTCTCVLCSRTCVSVCVSCWCVRVLNNWLVLHMFLCAGFGPLFSLMHCC